MGVIQFNDVTKNRKDFTIDNMNLSIPQGYITGFIGPNGSGKTTTIRLMMDLIQPNSGNIELFGVSNKNHHIKQKIGFVYDDLYMYEDYTIKKTHTIIAPLYTNWNENLFQTYLSKFNLPYKKRLKTFSKGMKMKCSLLFALSHEPELIIMDEPTAGLDPIFRRELLGIVQDIMVRDNQSIFLSTHITTDLDRIADYIVLIDDGKILLQKSMEDIREQYHLVRGKKELLDHDIRQLLRGIQETNVGFTALFEGDPHIFKEFEDDIVIEEASLEDIMFYLIGGAKDDVAVN